MALALNDLLAPQVIMGTISKLKIGMGRLSTRLGWNYFPGGEPPANGWGLSGPNVKETPVRSGTYRIQNATRTVAPVRAPGTPPQWLAPREVGQVSYTVARFHGKIRLDYEQLSFMSRAMGLNSVLDVAGADYVYGQQKYLAEKFNNATELLAAAMIRGHLYVRQDGDNWYPTLTVPGSGTYMDVNFQLASGNTGQLNMLGAGNIIGTTWSNAAAPIISNDLPEIMRAFTINTGMQVAEAWTDSRTWAKIITNTEVKNSAGTANTPFEDYRYQSPGGNGDGSQTAVLRGYPMIRWHISNEVIIDDGGTDPSPDGTGGSTAVQVIPPNSVVFMPPAEYDWQELLTFGEYVSDSDGMPAVKRPGMYMWKNPVSQPTQIELIGLFNACPMLKIPKAIAVGTVSF